MQTHSKNNVSDDGRLFSADASGASERLGRLLVADDEPRLLESLCSILRDKGFEVDEAMDGDAVCQQLQDNAYDLILLDIRMPGKSGLEIMAWLKETGIDSQVIIMSGHSDYRIVRQAFKLGACDYLKKPYDVDDLIQAVGDKVLERRQSRSRATTDWSNPLKGELFRRTLDHLPELVFLLDERKCFEYLNHKVESLTGLPAEELIGQPLSRLVHEDDIAKLPLFFERAEADEPITQEIKLKTHSGGVGYKNFDIILTSTLEVNPALAQATFSPEDPPFLGIARDITERKQTLELMEFRASHDSLTDLPNRNLFMDRLRLAVSQARRNGKKFAVFFIDLDNFKAINDAYGHGIGDQLLQKVASGLKHCLREGDTLARYGGDEFMALLPSLDEKKDAATVARKLLTSLEAPFRFEGCDLGISIGTSIGIALYPENGDEAETLIERADMAMYAVKREKKNDFRFYS
ncbi:MAG: diguanylate cyclase [Marinobacter sp.]|uniref:diguanylate cyclase domain-containing protein n=1 Tax=Marinobacter sp. TaxID=50741 RepID=UPI0032979C35